jgi:hypothetical protein
LRIVARVAQQTSRARARARVVALALTPRARTAMMVPPSRRMRPMSAWPTMPLPPDTSVSVR